MFKILRIRIAERQEKILYVLLQYNNVRGDNQFLSASKILVFSYADCLNNQCFGGYITTKNKGKW